ncbi:MAG TPA: response regulator [Candidatus Binatia bacterium]|nr:response regulator [Candidatus Binatia bacterium]
MVLAAKMRIVLKRENILLVDDDELLAKMVAELLRHKGYEVWTAGNGLDGFASYRQHQAETVVTDIDMPELDGFEMVRCIRVINPLVRTIYTSGAPEQYRGTLANEAQNFGAAVLRKPFAEMDLLKLISSSIRESVELESPNDWSTDRKKHVWRHAV